MLSWCGQRQICLYFILNMEALLVIGAYDSLCDMLANFKTILNLRSFCVCTTVHLYSASGGFEPPQGTEYPYNFLGFIQLLHGIAILSANHTQTGCFVSFPLTIHQPPFLWTPNVLSLWQFCTHSTRYLTQDRQSSRWNICLSIRIRRPMERRSIPRQVNTHFSKMLTADLGPTRPHFHCKHGLSLHG
jgi:hypothetical protein